VLPHGDLEESSGVDDFEGRNGERILDAPPSSSEAPISRIV
jgi:hypothetical protein